MEFSYEKDNKERIPLEHYLEEYRKLDPEEAAQRCGVAYDPKNRQFHIRLLGYSYLVDFPEFDVHKEEEGQEGVFLLLSQAAAKIIVLRFLISGQMVKSAGKYLTYREVPWMRLMNLNLSTACMCALSYGRGTMNFRPPPRSSLRITSPMLTRRRIWP